MKIYVASDHRGFELKQKMVFYMSQQGYEVVDFGPDEYRRNDDYPDGAIKVAKAVQDETNSRGLLLCGSGIGMYVTANKFRGIIASEVRSPMEAKEDRQHHNSNILVISADRNDTETTKAILDTWISTKFGGGRHARRIKKVKIIENENIKFSRIGPNIVPAVLSDNIQDYVEQISEYSAFSEVISVDIMDGKFVDSSTPDVFDILESISDVSVLLSIHLMVENPKLLLDRLERYDNVMMVYIHASVIVLQDLLKERPYETALVFNPSDDVCKYKRLVENVSTIQLMTVEPGRQGNKFEKHALSKQKELEKIGFAGNIHIDGGVNAKTLNVILETEKDSLMVGSAITKSKHPRKSFVQLSDLAESISKSRKYI